MMLLMKACIYAIYSAFFDIPHNIKTPPTYLLILNLKYSDLIQCYLISEVVYYIIELYKNILIQTHVKLFDIIDDKVAINSERRRSISEWESYNNSDDKVTINFEHR